MIVHALIASLLLASAAIAQQCVYYVPVQSCYGGSCPPQYYYVQPQQPIQSQQPQRQTPQVGSPGTPQFQPRPIVPNSNASDGFSLLPWREQIERRIAQVEADARGWSSVKRGPAGPQGPAGKDAEVDIDALAVAVAARMDPQVTVDVDQLAAQVVKKLPPVRVEWKTLDGTILKQEKPLGQPLKFESVQVGVK